MTACDLHVVEPLFGVLLEGLGACEVGFEELGFLLGVLVGGRRGGGGGYLLG